MGCLSANKKGRGKAKDKGVVSSPLLQSLESPGAGTGD